MPKTNTTNFLQHHGILGMKWGHRKASSVSEESHDSARAHAAHTKLKKEGISSLSNDELKSLTQRMQLEKQYKDLDSRTVTKGEKMTQEFLTSQGKQLANTYAQKYAVKGIDAAVKYAVKKASEGK